ncbi:unnamed protein product [Gongylonema pulchrum]|uniref:POT1PC domain-containing protein n=1 Tax=Gongylonema pulchrum TaxID=637853 RepID=A0A183E6R4_9BILA|nr:unnamed protein product [Gongylonema pulchrum]
MSLRDNTTSNVTKCFIRSRSGDRFSRMLAVGQIVQLHQIQAISLFISERRGVVLRCWDTTKPGLKEPLFPDSSIAELLCSDDELDKLAGEFRCDIIAFGKHADFIKAKVKPADILLLRNVQCYAPRSYEACLTMHQQGERYGRSITVLSDCSDFKKALLGDIAQFKRNLTSGAPSGSGIESRTSATAQQTTAESERVVTAQTATESEAETSSTANLATAERETTSGTAPTVTESEEQARRNAAAQPGTSAATRFAPECGPCTSAQAAAGCRYLHTREAIDEGICGELSNNEKRWANVRRRKLHAIHLGWIMKYLSKSWNFETNQQAPSSLGMYSVLATRGVQYLVNDLLTNVRNGGLVDRLMKLPETERENVLARFITLYLKAAYTGIVTQSSVSRRSLIRSAYRRI